MVDNVPVRTTETAPQVADSTDAEVRALSAIARRKVRSVFVPTCGGESFCKMLEMFEIFINQMRGLIFIRTFGVLLLVR